MPTSRRIEFDILPMLQPFGKQNLKVAHNEARQIAQALEEPFKNLGIDFNPKAIQGAKSLQNLFVQLSASVERTNKGLQITAQNAEGLTRIISLNKTDAGWQYDEKATITSANRLGSVKELQNAYHSLFNAMKQFYSLEEQGEAYTPAWEHAKDTVRIYEENLEELISTLTRRHHLSTEMNDDLGKELIAGKGQIAQTQEAMEHQRRQMELNHEVTMSSKAKQAQKQAVQQYVSALQTQYREEEKLVRLQQAKAPKQVIQAQQEVVNETKRQTQAVEQQAKSSQAYAEVQDKVALADKQHKQRLAELTNTTQKSVSIFGKFKETLKQVVSAGLSWKIFSAITQTFKKTIDTVKELDKSLVDLQIATGSTRVQAEELLYSYNQMAKELGATTQEIASAADSWLRQGYSTAQTNELIRSSMVLSKIGQIESAEATQYLTSALKGFDIEAEKSIEIVDKLAAIDLISATNASGLAEALSRTAASANLAGVEMEQLLGYVAVVGETTQKSMSQVGESKLI